MLTLFLWSTGGVPSALKFETFFFAVRIVKCSRYDFQLEAHR